MTEFIVDAVILALLGVAGLSIVASVALFILVIVAQFWRNDGAVLPEEDEDYVADVTTDDSGEVVSFHFEHVGYSASWHLDSELIVFSSDDTNRYESRAATLSDAHDQFREFVANQTTELCYP